MALASTTLSAAVGANDSTVLLTSIANLTTGQWLFVDGEAMQVYGPVTSATLPLTVRRGVGGTRVLPHATALTVYIGNADQFYTQDPEGKPPAAPFITPWINLITGAIWDVSGSAWVLIGGAAPGAPVTTTGTQTLTNKTLTAPTITAPVVTGSGTFTSWTASATGAVLQPDTTTAHTMLLKAYDVDGTAYKTFMTFTNGNTPDLTIAVPSGGTLVVQASTYKSSDGTSGATAGPFTTITAIEVKNGLVTTLTGS